MLRASLPLAFVAWLCACGSEPRAGAPSPEPLPGQAPQETVGSALQKSRSRDRAEFEAMVSRCRAAGVGIYVDAVLNHMTAQAVGTGGTGSAGTAYTKYEHPALYDEASFHEPRCTIAADDYRNSASTCNVASYWVWLISTPAAIPCSGRSPAI